MDVVKAAGTELAIPARLDYQMDKAPLDEQEIRKAEAHVGEWRGRRELYIPKFPPETIAKLRGSLDYPAIGSPEMSEGRQERDPFEDSSSARLRGRFTTASHATVVGERNEDRNQQDHVGPGATT